MKWYHWVESAKNLSITSRNHRSSSFKHNPLLGTSTCTSEQAQYPCLLVTEPTEWKKSTAVSEDNTFVCLIYTKRKKMKKKSSNDPHVQADVGASCQLALPPQCTFCIFSSSIELNDFVYFVGDSSL
jgi:hypothetical protein